MKSLLFWKRQVDEPTQSHEFLELAQEYVSLWKTAGVPILLSRQPDALPHFHKAQRHMQKKAIDFLRFNLEIMNEMVAAGQEIRSNKVYLWRALKKMNFIPPHDVFDMISDEDMIEVYTMDEHQVFRSYQFFLITSFSLEELLCLTWKELMHRPWRPMLSMSRKVVKARLGLLKNAEAWSVAPHIVTEIPTEEKRRFIVAPQMLMPLKQNNQIVGVIATNRGRVLDDTEDLL